MAFTFMFADKFPTLVQNDFENAYTQIQTTWSGISTMWSVLDLTLANKKRLLCENYLVGWWLADMYPQAVTGILSNGGMPLTSKNIGGTSISFLQMDSQDSLKCLQSNAFGLQALAMIQSAPERMGIYG